jgi:hypothetical protein
VTAFDREFAELEDAELYDDETGDRATSPRRGVEGRGVVVSADATGPAPAITDEMIEAAAQSVATGCGRGDLDSLPISDQEHSAMWHGTQCAGH